MNTPVEYLNVPPQFRDPNNPWNKLAAYILDNGARDVRLVPRQSVNPDKAWEHAWLILQDKKKQEFARCAIAAWCLWTYFESFSFHYDN